MLCLLRYSPKKSMNPINPINPIKGGGKAVDLIEKGVGFLLCRIAIEQVHRAKEAAQAEAKECATSSARNAEQRGHLNKTPLQV